MSSIAKGDEGAGHIISETAKQVVGGLFGKQNEEWSSDSTSMENMTHSISSTVLRGTVVAVASKAKHEFSKRTDKP